MELNYIKRRLNGGSPQTLVETPLIDTVREFQVNIIYILQSRLRLREKM